MWDRKNIARTGGRLFSLLLQVLESENTFGSFGNGLRQERFTLRDVRGYFSLELNVGFTVMTRVPSEIFVPFFFLRERERSLNLFYLLLDIHNLYFAFVTKLVLFRSVTLNCARGQQQNLVSTSPISRKTSPKRDLAVPVCPRH